MSDPSLVKATYGYFAHEHWCPACKMTHQIAVERPFNNGAQWSLTFGPNGPTFSPSIRTLIKVVDGRNQDCHYFIRDGQIQYCADSYHDFRGQTIPLPPLPPGEFDPPYQIAIWPSEE